MTTLAPSLEDLRALRNAKKAAWERELLRLIAGDTSAEARQERHEAYRAYFDADLEWRAAYRRRG